MYTPDLPFCSFSFWSDELAPISDFWHYALLVINMMDYDEQQDNKSNKVYVHALSELKD